MDLERELRVAETLAREAGALVLRYFGTDLRVDTKAGNEPVTRADREASDHIVGGLRAAFPGDIVISEEAPDDRRRLEADGARRRLRCATTADPGALRLVASRSHRSPEIDAVKSALGIADEMNIGSVGLKLGLIALDERDLYVNPSSKSSAWDTCAPEAILHEAGGRITDLDGEPLRYDRLELKNDRGLLASNGPPHDQLVEKLRPLFRKRT